jgi:hypothetical protein
VKIPKNAKEWHDMKVDAFAMVGVFPVETENERRLRVLAEAKEHLDFCEKDWQDRGEAAVTPFAAWKDND